MTTAHLGHACVLYTTGSDRVLVDPGTLSSFADVTDLTAVLVTHEHADHWTPEMVRATRAPIFTIAAVAAQIRDQAPDVAERVTVVRPG